MTRVQFPDEAACISNSTYIFKKGMNPIILPPGMGKIVEQVELFKLGMATGLGEGKLTPNSLIFARAREGLGKYIYSILNIYKPVSLISRNVWFDLVLWHINHYSLFNAKSFLYIYIEYIISKHIL